MKKLLTLFTVGCSLIAANAQTAPYTNINTYCGANPNDGTGWPLRVAMLNLNTNLIAISNAFWNLQNSQSSSVFALSTINTNFTLGILYTNIWNRPILVSGVSAFQYEAFTGATNYIDTVVTNGVIASVGFNFSGNNYGQRAALASFVVQSNQWWWFTNSGFVGGAPTYYTTNGQITILGK